jgi:hypothetical protein
LLAIYELECTYDPYTGVATPNGLFCAFSHLQVLRLRAAKAIQARGKDSQLRLPLDQIEEDDALALVPEQAAAAPFITRDVVRGMARLQAIRVQ